MFVLIQLIRKEKLLFLLGMHKGKHEAELILVPFDFVCVYYLPASFPHRIDTSCRLQCFKGFSCMVQVPVRGFRARPHERGAMLRCGEGLAPVSAAAQGPGAVGWWVGVSEPASPRAGPPELMLHREPGV